MPIFYAIVALLVVLAVARLSDAYLPMPEYFRAVVNIVFALMVVGILLWLVNTYIPLAGAIKALLNVVVFVAACVGVLQAFGLWDSVVGTWRTFRSRHSPYATDPTLPRH